MNDDKKYSNGQRQSNESTSQEKLSSFGNQFKNKFPLAKNRLMTIEEPDRESDMNYNENIINMNPYIGDDALSD